MKLRNKLMITFFTTIFVPVILVFACMIMLSSYQIRTIIRNAEFNGVADVFSSSSIQIFDSMTAGLENTIREMAAKSPDRFLQKEVVQELNEELMNKYSFLVVRINGTVFYNGSPMAIDELLEILPEYGAGTANEGNNGVFSNTDSFTCLIKQQDVIFTDGQMGSIFIVTSVGELIPSIKNMFLEMAVVIVIILIFVTLILTTWVYRDILRPLGELQKATKAIKEGNLDYELEIRGKDEIGQLCMDFEEMRQRLKNSAEEKVQYDTESKELISNISHDLKTPITAIKGYVEGIMDGVASSPEKLDKYIRTIYNKANDMDRLIDELTFYSKIDTNKIPYTFAPINISSYFRDCVEEVGIELEAKNIDLNFFDYLTGEITVIADAEQLKRVINNIISNSVKYLDKKKGTINIRLKDVGDFVQVEIEDNGKGIANRDLPYIFDRFYRTDASRNSSQGGSGIGLSIVRKIVEDHGGKIWATSKESTGTVMHFVLRKYQEVLHEQDIDY